MIKKIQKNLLKISIHKKIKKFNIKKLPIKKIRK